MAIGISGLPFLFIGPGPVVRTRIDVQNAESNRPLADTALATRYFQRAAVATDVR